VPFTDGVVRPVFEHADGGQCVVDDSGEQVKGFWILADEPLTADGWHCPDARIRPSAERAN
jgi:hypothetical protein